MTEPKHIRLLGSRSRIVFDDGAVTEILSNHWTMPGPGYSPGILASPTRKARQVSGSAAMIFPQDIEEI